MKHVERHHTGHTPAQIFDLVADVEQYPAFVPWVISAKVIRRKDRTMWTSMTMGARFINRQFTTVASLDRPHRMEIKSHDALFEHFEQIWTFEPANEGGAHVECQIDLRFKSCLLQALIGTSFAQRAKPMVKAYLRRAQRLYGTPQFPSDHKPQPLTG